MPDQPERTDGFRFLVPDPKPDWRRITDAEAEHILLEKVKKQEVDLREALFDLTRFYVECRRFDESMEILNRVEALSDGPEEKALCYLKMGAVAERIHDFSLAAAYYLRAYHLEPEQTLTWYFINNNLGFSLNQLGRFAEAEGYCRSSIEIDPERHNAYKNMAVSFEGQGKFAEAAANYIQAVKRNASDPRAYSHLSELLERNPQLLKENPTLVTELENCGGAVAFARKLIDKILDDFSS